MLCYLSTPKHQTRQLLVVTVEKAGHMMQKLSVLLGIKSAIPAENMAIMRSIVEVLKKVSLVGEAEHIEKRNKKQGRRRLKPPRTVN